MSSSSGSTPEPVGSGHTVDRIDFLRAGGETGALIAEMDWTDSPIGPVRDWPQTLLSALGMLLHSPTPIVMLWGPKGVMLYNDAYSVFAGGRHPRLLGSNVLEGWPEVADFNRHVMQVGLAGGSLSYKNQELVLYRNGLPESVVMNLDYSPVFDEAGRPAGVIAFVLEVTEQVRAEAALKAERDRAHSVLAGMTDGFLLLAHDFTILEINAEGVRVDGRPRETFIGQNHWDVWPDTFDMSIGHIYRQAMTERTAFAIENRYEFPDGRITWLDVRGNPVEEGLAIFFRDITERKLAEDHLRLMVHELNHRVKNSLATVQAIATQTLRSGGVPHEVREALTSRLLALARAHDVLTDTKWAGAELEEIAAQAAEPYGADRFKIEGPRVTLPPRTAIAMALAFHELATNAAKYGPLSNDTGQVHLGWRLDTDHSPLKLHLVWRETGGPPVSPPKRKGFGSRLIQQGLAAEFVGEVRMEFLSSGLVCEVEAAVPSAKPEDWADWRDR
ncbi:MAG: HWE histidine kinase domain-containing protein [Phenylobacterium sp.]|uniref:sensor histidine kinase n=1 Tax=Phenylobacterium sp. TaxID=1871053 RepID=UPI002717CCE2|nr:HWE histidine kinase domain-containing protein [Phenylobacterium sp.]MDO8902821.1 HWE histidine kinase domain-containing protein [Phenylobacterium sp.]